MYRGSTPTLTFRLPKDIDLSMVDKLRIDFSQANINIFSKDLSECFINGNDISVKLTEEETLRFDSKKNPVKMQLRIGIGEDRIPSDTLYTMVKDIVKEGRL